MTFQDNLRDCRVPKSQIDSVHV